MKIFSAGERLFAADLNDNFDETKSASNITGGTMDAARIGSGTLNADRIPRGRPPAFRTSTNATETLNFALSVGDEVIRSTRGGTLTFAGSNYTAGVSKTVIWNGGGSNRSVVFPAGWVFVSAKPTTLLANKRAVLTVTCHGTTEAECTAAWAVQA